MSSSSVSVNPEKVEAVMSWERPKLVFKGYYRRGSSLSGMTCVRRHFRN